jgi:hypothetical protein
MTSFLIDINVWLALTWMGHPSAAAAKAWLDSLPREQTQLLFCRTTQLGFMRLLTNQKAMGGSALTVEEALNALDCWHEDPRVEFAHERPGIEPALRRGLSDLANQPATRAIMDAYLAAFAETAGATLVTFDKALASAAERRKVRSIRLEPSATPVDERRAPEA